MLLRLERAYLFKAVIINLCNRREPPRRGLPYISTSDLPDTTVLPQRREITHGRNELWLRKDPMQKKEPSHEKEKVEEPRSNLADFGLRFMREFANLTKTGEKKKTSLAE